MSFLYGARVFNLYKVEAKSAYQNADRIGPWPPVTFRPSGLTYYFPFRLQLRQMRLLNEPLVRAEFAYVAENLLLRGGYRKTHFQADQTTLQAVSEMGEPHSGLHDDVAIEDWETYEPLLTNRKELVDPPRVFAFKELFLQALLRKHLSQRETLSGLLPDGLSPDSAELLSEKAFPEGHVDLLIKEAAPTGISPKFVVEAKTGRALGGDVAQLRRYMELLGEECVGGALVAAGFSNTVKSQAIDSGVKLLSYDLDFPAVPVRFAALLETFRLLAA